MTIDRLTDDERDALAAELALGLLEGPELDDARALAAGDPAFRAEVGEWSARFAPMLDTVEEKAPSGAIWQSILAMVEPRPFAANDDEPGLRRSLNRWRLATGGLGAIAASLALLLVAVPNPPDSPAVPPQAVAAAPMVAMISGDGPGPVRLVANWDPADQQLIVTPAMKPALDAGKAMELWAIPADGTPRSVGVMPAEGPMRGTIDPAMGTMLSSGATLAISIEQSGGSPTGAPLGPVVATGQLVGV